MFKEKFVEVEYEVKDAPPEYIKSEPYKPMSNWSIIGHATKVILANKVVRMCSK